MKNTENLVRRLLKEAAPTREAVSQGMVNSRLSRLQSKVDDCKEYFTKIQGNMMALNNAMLQAKAVINSKSDEDSLDKLDKVLEGMMDDLTDFTNDMRNAVADSNSFVRDVAKIKDA